LTLPFAGDILVTMRLDEKDILTVAAAAALARCDEQAVYRAARRGDLTRLAIDGAAVLFWRKSVERWAATLTAKTP
jgi:hypothetical protein